VNLHFTPVSIQSAYFKAREKQEKNTKIEIWRFLIQIIKKRWGLDFGAGWISGEVLIG